MENKIYSNIDELIDAVGVENLIHKNVLIKYRIINNENLRETKEQVVYNFINIIDVQNKRIMGNYLIGRRRKPCIKKLDACDCFMFNEDSYKRFDSMVEAFSDGYDYSVTVFPTLEDMENMIKEKNLSKDNYRFLTKIFGEEISDEDYSNVINEFVKNCR